MNYHEIFGVVALIVSIISFIPYLSSILKGKTKPSVASRWTWTLLAFIAVLSSWVAGAPWQVLLLPSWLCISQLTVSIFSIKYGDNKWDILNKTYIGVAIVGVLLWTITGNPLLALGFSIIADLFASIPNFRHVFFNSEQEDKFAWTLGWLAALFEILAIKNWTFASSAWATYFILNMTLILLFLYRKKIKKWD